MGYALDFSTAEAPAAQRFDAWREFLRHDIGMTPEPPAGHRSKGPLTSLFIDADAALRISERTLEGVFAQAGLGFATYVRRRRLEECREALIVDPVRSIVDLAFAWGFNSLSSFYRAFIAEFDASPGDCREQRARRESSRAPGRDEPTARNFITKPGSVRRPA